jgi:hypothetical protein
VSISGTVRSTADTQAWAAGTQGKSRMKLFITTLLILLTIISRGQEIGLGIFSRRNVAGDYSVTTTVTLKTDNRFTYNFSGHMAQVQLEGSYRTNADDGVILLTYDTTNQNDLNYRNSVNMAPKAFRYQNNRLYEIDDNGRLVKSRRF